MGLQQSKEELLYQQVNYGNVEGIKALRREGAGLEWVDKEGKTPLILACMKPNYLHVVKALIELGANVNAYRPGSHGGTPLHHAAKRGLEQTVTLLLSHGANASVMNDDCQTALDLARAKGNCNVVRAIESRICIFSGWLRELYGPGILEALIPQLVTRKVWAVILPCDHRSHMNPLKFELAIYPELQLVDGEREIRGRRRRMRRKRRMRLGSKVSQPRTIISLWKVEIAEPNFNQMDPVVVIVDKGAKSRFKFLSAHEGDRQQLVSFYNACKGMPQFNTTVAAAPAYAPVPTPSQPNTFTSATKASAPASASEDIELAMAINASIQSAMAEGVPPFSDVQTIPEVSNTNGWGSSSDNTTHNGWGPPDGPSPSSKSSNGWSNKPATDKYNGWAVPEPGSSAISGHVQQSQHDTGVVIPSVQDMPPLFPSAPPINETFDDGPIHYPSIDSSPIDLTLPVIESRQETNEVKEGKESRSGTSEVKEESSAPSSSCIICLDAAVEGACIPCGHMAGCMSCLNEIKAKKWGCPVCRAKIDQIVRLYAV